jgi:hypothetical protein
VLSFVFVVHNDGDDRHNEVDIAIGPFHCVSLKDQSVAVFVVDSLLSASNKVPFFLLSTRRPGHQH